jgi:hypothetical protein
MRGWGGGMGAIGSATAAAWSLCWASVWVRAGLWAVPTLSLAWLYGARAWGAGGDAQLTTVFDHAAWIVVPAASALGAQAWSRGRARARRWRAKVIGRYLAHLGVLMVGGVLTVAPVWLVASIYGAPDHVQIAMGVLGVLGLCAACLASAHAASAAITPAGVAFLVALAGSTALLVLQSAVWGATSLYTLAQVRPYQDGVLDAASGLFVLSWIGLGLGWTVLAIWSRDTP